MTGGIIDSLPRNFLRTGFFRRRAGRPVRIPFAVRFLDASALAAVRHIHQEGLRRIAEPGLIRTDSDAFFAAHFGGAGRTLGVYADDTLIAYAILGIPTGPDYPYDRFGDDLGLPDAERTRVGQLIGVGVLPEWRGNGLHFQLCQWRLDLGRAAGCWHAAAVSAPGNPHSWRNLLAVGLRIEKLKLLGGDKLRYLFHADLRAAPPLDPATAVAVAAMDLAGQRALLERGYQGYAPVSEADGPGLWYARPLHS